MNLSQKIKRRERRHLRVRAKLQGTAEVPRLSTFRSNQHIYAQLIDDQKGQTILECSDLSLQKKDNKKSLAKALGQLLAEKALAKKIEKVVFDRGGRQYHGRIKALAEGAREGGLKF